MLHSVVNEEDLCYTNEVGDEDDSNEANLSAYVMDGASQLTEQDGVLYVVHGWIQQVQPEKVSGPYVSSAAFFFFLRQVWKF